MRWILGQQPRGEPPLTSDIAAGLSNLRSVLDDCVVRPNFDNRPVLKRKKGQPWPTLPPEEAFTLGMPFLVVLNQGVRDSLHRSLMLNVCDPARAATAARKPSPVAWYGQDDVSWIAYYDACRELGLASYPRAAETRLAEWVTIARSCGWWWSGEKVCVIAERPAVLRTERVSGDPHGVIRLVRDGHPSLEYRDGWRPPLT